MSVRGWSAQIKDLPKIKLYVAFSLTKSPDGTEEPLPRNNLQTYRFKSNNTYNMADINISKRKRTPWLWLFIVAILVVIAWLGIEAYVDYKGTDKTEDVTTEEHSSAGTNTGQ